MLNLLILTGLVIAAALITALIVISDRIKPRVYDVDGADLIRVLKGER
jgi:hypothetical protein